MAGKPAMHYVFKRLVTMLWLPTMLASLPVSSFSATENQGFTPFVKYAHTYDSNLLNRSNEGTGAAPQSDQVNYGEVGTFLNYQLSRQRFTGRLSVSDTHHQRFKERNTNGNSHRLRWDSEIGKTLKASLEESSVSDQAPIQTGNITANKRKQDSTQASLTWNFHPSYAVLSQFSNTKTRFTGSENTNESVIAGLNRNDESNYIGFAYKVGTGSSTALLFKQASGEFPVRQIIGPGQTVSNNFDQSETELLTKWNYSEITALTLSLSSVNRQHQEIQSRDFSGTNYRLEVAYQPTVQTNWNLVWGKQIVGVSDASNSDALTRQIGIAMNMELTSKVSFQLAYSPQELQFDGSDGFNSSPRTENLKESLAGLEFHLDPRLTLGANLRKRSRDSTLANTDYSAHSMNFFVRYEH